MLVVGRVCARARVLADVLRARFRVYTRACSCVLVLVLVRMCACCVRARSRARSCAQLVLMHIFMHAHMNCKLASSSGGLTSSRSRCAHSGQ